MICSKISFILGPLPLTHPSLGEIASMCLRYPLGITLRFRQDTKRLIKLFKASHCKHLNRLLLQTLRAPLPDNIVEEILPIPLSAQQVTIALLIPNLICCSEMLAEFA